MAKSKQQKMQEQFSAMFAGMDPIEDQTAEPAAEQPKKKRGRPKKTEESTEATTAKKNTTSKVRSAYELAKEDEERRKQEGMKIQVSVKEGDPFIQNPITVPMRVTKADPSEQKKINIPVTVVKEEPKPVQQKKSEHKSPFSVWLDQKTAADLKMYSAISGEKTTDIVERALKEYMNRHKLTEDQKSAYKQKMMKNLNDI